MATNSANTSTSHTGNGSAGPFSISFPYVGEIDVDVFVGGVLKTKTTHYTFTSATQITFTSGNEPSNGTSILIQRDTEIGSAQVDFTDGSVLTETDLDTNTKQLFLNEFEIAFARHVSVFEKAYAIGKQFAKKVSDESNS